MTRSHLRNEILAIFNRNRFKTEEIEDAYMTFFRDASYHDGTSAFIEAQIKCEPEPDEDIYFSLYCEEDDDLTFSMESVLTPLGKLDALLGLMKINANGSPELR